MITEQDLQEAIAECQGERNPDANTCIMLAAFYIIKNELFGKSEQFENGASYAAAPTVIDTGERFIDYQKDTELSKLIDGKEAYPVWEVMDELMQTLKMIMPPLYSGTMQKIRAKTQ